MVFGAPAPQVFPHCPQLSMSLLSAKPSSTTPLQSLSMLSQTSAPPSAPGQETSQPFEATPSRSACPGRHEPTAQRPPMQRGVALVRTQGEPQAPQLLGSI